MLAELEGLNLRLQSELCECLCEVIMSFEDHTLSTLNDEEIGFICYWLDMLTIIRWNVDWLSHHLHVVLERHSCLDLR